MKKTSSKGTNNDDYFLYVFDSVIEASVFVLLAGTFVHAHSNAVCD